jgi:hypothetical protein
VKPHTVDGQQREHGNQIEHALHDDRRHRGRRGEAFTPREQIRTQHIAHTRRQNRQSCEPDDGRP